MAVDEASYQVIKKMDRFELRDYAPQLLAEIVVAGELEDAGSKAFKSLFNYISGDNKSQKKIAMTAPVSQQPAGEKIAMTAPVGQERVEEGWAVSFMMPESYSLETVPLPDNPEIILRQVPARRIAAVRYSGFWSEKSYRRYLAELESWIEKEGLTATGEAIWARYNPPFMPWFMRRNEILIPVESAER